MNKRGAETVLIVVVVVGVLLTLWFGFQTFAGGDFGKLGLDASKFNFETRSFQSINDNLRFLDFVFGQIPDYLVDLTSPSNAVIIVIGVWLLLFLAFGDIIALFGTFSKGVSWVIALILAIIAANIKLITIFTVFLLSITAFLGAFSVVAGVISIFVLFIAFHFGSEKVREWILKRREHDLMLKAAAGNAEAKAGLETLRSIGRYNVSH